MFLDAHERSNDNLALAIACAILLTQVSYSLGGIAGGPSRDLNSNSHDSIPSSRTSLVDVFPLQHNLQYSYEYEARSISSELVSVVMLSVDSGIVTYVVKDSVLENDTSIVWHVEEVANLCHHYYNAFSSYPHVDTLYLTSDTSQVVVRESTTGRHELLANGLLWRFPPAPLLGAIFDTIPFLIYRLADTSSYVATHQGANTGYSFGSDSFFFSKDSGLYRYERYYNYGLNAHTSTTLHARLLNGPVLTVQRFAQAASDFRLENSFPNPFNPSTTIRFSIPERSHVHLAIFNLLGQQIAELANEEMSSGNFERTWNANVASGFYFYRLEVVSMTEPNKRFVDVKKMIVLK